MNIFALSDVNLLKKALACKCPKCQKGDLFRGPYSLELKDRCEECGFDISKNDSADGPAVLLIFVLGALFVPLAIIFENLFAPPLWVHAVLWGALSLICTIGSLKPLKTYVIGLQYKHRASDWGE